MPIRLTCHLLEFLEAGLGTITFIGYFIALRRKYWSNNKKEKRNNVDKIDNNGLTSQEVDFTDHEAVQRFFLQEVQMGEELLNTGNIHGGVHHLSLAVAMCDKPLSLLSILQRTLPAKIYQLLLPNLENAQKNIRKHAMASIRNSRARSVTESVGEERCWSVMSSPASGTDTSLDFPRNTSCLF